MRFGGEVDDGACGVVGGIGRAEYAAAQSRHHLRGMQVAGCLSGYHEVFHCVLLSVALGSRRAAYCVTNLVLCAVTAKSDARFLLVTARERFR